MIRGTKKMNDRKRTIDHMKQQREVPAAVRERVKEFNRIKKTILKALTSGRMTIPRLAEETGLAQEVVTYHLMTMRKYGAVEVDGVDDMDEYYFYTVTG